MPDNVPAAAHPLKLPALPFAAVGRAVMCGSVHVATARSSTFARRIAAALNDHAPNKKGV